MFVTLKLKGNSYNIHSVSDGEKTITTDSESFTIMPWKMVTHYGKLISLKESAELIEAVNHKKKLINEFVSENKEMVNHFLSVYESMRENEIAKIFPKIYEFGHKKLCTDIGCLVIQNQRSDFVPRNGEIEKFRDRAKMHNGYVPTKDEDRITELVEAIEPLIEEPLNELTIYNRKRYRSKVPFHNDLAVSIFLRLTGRSEKERLSYRDINIVVSLYQSFYNASLNSLKHQVRSERHILYHIMRKAGYEPFEMIKLDKNASRSRTESEIEAVFQHLGWDYVPIVGTES